MSMAVTTPVDSALESQTGGNELNRVTVAPKRSAVARTNGAACTPWAEKSNGNRMCEISGSLMDFAPLPARLLRARREPSDRRPRQRREVTEAHADGVAVRTTIEHDLILGRQ